MGWNTILVPHDFSGSAKNALAIACEEARTHRAAIVVLHVVDLPYQLGPDAVVVPEATGAPISLKQYALDGAEEELGRIVDLIAKDGLVATGAVAVGNPVDEIIGAIAEHKIDLIVMGTHGRTGLRHLMAGSVTERVVRTSQVPVLTIRHPGNDE